MVDNIFDDAELYVCITHKVITPCDEDGYHLVSNWPSDVKKILDIIDNPRYYTDN